MLDYLGTAIEGRDTGPASSCYTYSESLTIHLCTIVIDCSACGLNEVTHFRCNRVLSQTLESMLTIQLHPRQAETCPPRLRQGVVTRNAHYAA